jgi:hypothetical protein
MVVIDAPFWLFFAAYFGVLWFDLSYLIEFKEKFLFGLDAAN